MLTTRSDLRVSLIRPLVLLILIGVALPASADAASKKVTVPGTLVFQNQQRPGDPGNCSAVGFIQWADVPNTVSAAVFYMRSGKEASNFGTPPFNDTYKLVATYSVPPGSHWIAVTRNWADGPVANTCENGRKKLEAIVTNPVREEGGRRLLRRSAPATSVRSARG